MRGSSEHFQVARPIVARGHDRAAAEVKTLQEPGFGGFLCRVQPGNASPERLGSEGFDLNDSGRQASRKVFKAVDVAHKPTVVRCDPGKEALP
jgi:hypothetical protein